MDLSIIGYLAGFLTMIGVLPQVIEVIKRNSAQGISLFFIIIILSGVFLWFVYGFVLNDFPMIIFNGISVVLWIIILFYKIKDIFSKKQN